MNYLPIWDLYQFLYGAIVFFALGAIFGMWAVKFEKQTSKMIIGLVVLGIITILFLVYHYHSVIEILKLIQ